MAVTIEAASGWRGQEQDHCLRSLIELDNEADVVAVTYAVYVSSSLGGTDICNLHYKI